MFFDKIASVKKLTLDSGSTTKESYVAVSGLEAVRLNIQPLDPQSLALSPDGAVGQSFKGFTTVSGIREGYMLTVSGTTDDFIVRGVEYWNFGPLPHFEILLDRMRE